MVPDLMVPQCRDFSLTLKRTCTHVVLLAEHEININVVNHLFKHFSCFESSKHNDSPFNSASGFSSATLSRCLNFKKLQLKVDYRSRSLKTCKSAKTSESDIS